jgi:uncharacterized protein YbcC (UPF0753/DUF2309 family)
LAAEVTAIDWPRIISERIGAWAGSYLDEGQALWSGARATSTFATWRAYAIHDLTPEIHGLEAFANYVETMPTDGADVITICAQKLRLTEDALASYLHQLLLGMGGWSQYARYKLWQAELNGALDTTLRDLLAVRIVWEAALFERAADALSGKWESVVKAHAAAVIVSPELTVQSVLQDAYDHAAQRALAQTLATPATASLKTRPRLQAAFCIDVRSEIFRRALESQSVDIQTLGFAGFFGLAVSHKRLASDIEELRLPVLLNPIQLTCSGDPAETSADQLTRFRRRAKRAWGRFKLAAVSSFAFVEAAGPIYALKLITDGLGLIRKKPANDPAPRFRNPVDRETRAKTAAAILRAMSLTDGFSRLVLLVGHGANVVNNPHASALHCGACGGYSGEVNARLLVSLLNDSEVRNDLTAVGINIPGDTIFIGALHDTTTDCVRLYKDDHDISLHRADITQAGVWLAAAGKLARAERAPRLPNTKADGDVDRRSRDWSETRPEWGLAGCKAFIAAPRRRTAGKRLDGRAFLHDYDWRKDDDFSILELILTAPVVVASWISLQYYGSTVAPQLFGAGNKLLHNVVGGLGVFEGNGGTLRAGLPWQSIHDGERYIHEPLRLAVCIEAPREAITKILVQHPQVRTLFDNRWLYLYALNDEGHMTWRYRSGVWMDV